MTPSEQATEHSSYQPDKIERGRDMEGLTSGNRPAGSDPGPQWIKSSLSFCNSNCVEVASLPGGHIGVRDSKDIDGPVLQFTTSEWHAFLGGARNGEFDRFSERLSRGL